ncbi:MAG: hypothetical protein ABL888_20260, partial [Pirellulaceae bacterium]
SPAKEQSFNNIDSHLCVQLDESQLKSIMEKVKENARNCMSSAPVTTVHPGESSQVTDLSWRPFVTSLNEIKGDFATSYKPELTAFFEGTAVDIKTSELNGEKLDLQVNSKTTKIKRVRTVALKKPQKDGSLKIQFPETESQSMNLLVPFEIGQSCLIVLGEGEEECRVEIGVPIPGLSKVFRNTSIGKYRAMRMLLITIKRA